MDVEKQTTPESNSAEARGALDPRLPALIMPRPTPEEEEFFARLLAVDTTPDMARRWRAA